MRSGSDSGCVERCVVLAACAAPARTRGRGPHRRSRPTVAGTRAGSGPAHPRRADRVLGIAPASWARRRGRPDMLLASVSEADATPADCVSPAYRLQRVVYEEIRCNRWRASRGQADTSTGPPASGFCGVGAVRPPRRRADDLRRVGRQWQQCSGKAVVKHLRGVNNTDVDAAVSDVTVAAPVVSATVTTKLREPIPRISANSGAGHDRFEGHRWRPHPQRAAKPCYRSAPAVTSRASASCSRNKKRAGSE